MTVRESISVVIPAFNVEGFIEQTLRSVLKQSVLPGEIVVVDDGSTDKTFAIIQRIVTECPAGLIKVIKQQNSGPGAARNRAISEAKGEWIAFLDGDDIWLPAKIAHVCDAISQNRDATMILHDEYLVDLRGQQTIVHLHSYYEPDHPLFLQIYRGNFISTSCVVVRKEAVITAGGFNDRLPSAQDWDLWLRMAPIAKLVCIPIPLEKYVLRGGSVSTDVMERYHCIISISHYYLKQVESCVGRTKAFSVYMRRILMCHYEALKASCEYSELIWIPYFMFRMPIELIRAYVKWSKTL